MEALLLATGSQDYETMARALVTIGATSQEVDIKVGRPPVSLPAPRLDLATFGLDAGSDSGAGQMSGPLLCIGGFARGPPRKWGCTCSAGRGGGTAPSHCS